MEELLLDFEDFLRRRGLKKWGKSDPLAVEIRNLVYRSNRTCKTYWTYFEEEEGAANVLICLIHQTNFLLDRQLHALEKFFLREGGFTEKLYRERMKRRNVFRC